MLRLWNVGEDTDEKVVFEKIFEGSEGVMNICGGRAFQSEETTDGKPWGKKLSGMFKTKWGN